MKGQSFIEEKCAGQLYQELILHHDQILNIKFSGESAEEFTLFLWIKLIKVSYHFNSNNHNFFTDCLFIEDKMNYLYHISETVFSF